MNQVYITVGQFPALVSMVGNRLRLVVKVTRFRFSDQYFTSTCQYNVCKVFFGRYSIVKVTMETEFTTVK